ncbi:MAG TPA: divalent metal cation transporter [Planctomycetota bacterium]|nr:divalent metal cation transporter [Planctomycetota bacterium]HRR79254.1 divalent metal cation transporter [Planctomycetota bacterium]HRT94024.1 divalent metal cation transporter [Planctomycetota bacterium]
MSEAKSPGGAAQATELQRGLPMVAKWDPEALAREKAMLADLETKGMWARLAGYSRKMGPGWMQSALTLGSGSFFSSFFAGAMFGYSLLWVQPLGMLLGIIMFMAIAHQTLSTGARPFDAMRRYVHPAVAWAWALTSLAATVIWHFPQYSCGGTAAADLAEYFGWAGAAKLVGARLFFGGVMLAICIAVTWLYGSGSRGIRLFDKLIKLMVAVIVVSFMIVVVRTGIRWQALWEGLTRFQVPKTKVGIEVMMGGLSAAVGINMTFLFPYALLARGWGREHRGLAKFDLALGMWLPFVLATGFLVMAAANTLYDPANPVTTRIGPDKAAQVLGAAAGPVVGRLVFDLGVLAMVISSIILHMLVAAFIACEIFGLEPTGWRYRLTSLIPIPGVLGTVVQFPLWLPVVTSGICFIFLPIAYVAFFVLHNRRDYLGADKPTGARAWAWNIAMLIAIGVVTSYAGWWLVEIGLPKLFGS